MDKILCEIKKLAAAVQDMVRPFLTFYITALFNTLLVWAVVNGDLSVNDYIVSVGPTNAMIIGFWFAEKAALRDPTQKGKNDPE